MKRTSSPRFHATEPEVLARSEDRSVRNNEGGDNRRLFIHGPEPAVSHILDDRRPDTFSISFEDARRIPRRFFRDERDMISAKDNLDPSPAKCRRNLIGPLCGVRLNRYGNEVVILLEVNFFSQTFVDIVN